MLPLEVALNDDSQSCLGEVVVEDEDEANVGHESHFTKKCSKENKDIISGDVKSVVKETEANQMATLVGEGLDEVLRKTFYNAKGVSDLSLITALCRMCLNCFLLKSS